MFNMFTKSHMYLFHTLWLKVISSITHFWITLALFQKTLPTIKNINITNALTPDGGLINGIGAQPQETHQASFE